MTALASTPLRTPAATMRAAVVQAPGSVVVADAPLPTPGPGQLRVRLQGCGVCASNIPPFEGRDWFTYPMEPGALGHEGWGIVDALGPGVSSFRIGERVATLSQHAYAQYDLADVSATVKLPPALDGSPLPAEPLGCALNIFRRADIRPGQTVAIVGAGFLGLLLSRLAANAGARVIALSRRPFSLDVASRFGASETILMDDHWRIIHHVNSLTRQRFCDVVIEATGKEWPLNLAAELTRERGRLVVAGYHQDGLRSVNMQLWNWRGLDVINAHERDPAVYLHGMTAAVGEVAQGRLDPAPLYTHVFPLEQLGDALRATHARADGFIKALIRM
ncbi:MAG TPA: zinc-binding dehydrogenase [Phycisphaerae bacterium]|nr:zinc-binding dehydrogenase [Phycisphaerae bacterium]